MNKAQHGTKQLQWDNKKYTILWETKIKRTYRNSENGTATGNVR